MNSQATFSAVSVVFVLSASLNDVKPLSPILLSVCYVSNRIINKVLSCVVWVGWFSPKRLRFLRTVLVVMSFTRTGTPLVREFLSLFHFNVIALVIWCFRAVDRLTLNAHFFTSQNEKRKSKSFDRGIVFQEFWRFNSVTVPRWSLSVQWYQWTNERY